MFDATTIAANQARMESARSGFDGTREELANLLLPHYDHFQSAFVANSAPRTETPFDEYAALALQDGVAAFEGFTMPRGQKWQAVAISDETLAENLAVQQWLETLTNRVFAMRNDPKSGFTSAIHECVESLYAFGEQSLWVDKRFDARGRFAGLSYQAEAIYAIWVENDAEGAPMRIHRRLHLTAEQSVAKWGENTPPEVAKRAKQQGGGADSFEFLHVIEKNPNADPDRIDNQSMPWRACYYSVTDKLPFMQGGYRTLRRIVSRWHRASSKNYGTGPSRLVLGSIRAAQVMMQDRVIGTENTAKPPLLAEDDEMDRGIIDLSPLGITYGGLENGRRKIEPLFQSIDLSGARDLHMEVRELIDRAMYRHLLQINREQKTHISATRTIEEIAEKGVLLSPLARQEKELFAPMLDAELDLMWDEGLLDDMPSILIDWFRRGGGVTATYDNELNRMLLAAEAAGYFRMTEQVAAMAQSAPEAVDAFHREYPPEKVVAGLGKVNGVPARWRATDEEKAARDEAKAQAVQTQQLIEAAPAVGQAIKNITEAGAISAG